MSSSTGKTGVLLVNLGTPDAPSASAVRRYLAEFLWDRRVVEIPRWLWWPILHGIVLTVRPRKSAKAYRSIWSERGSPLLAFTEDLGRIVDAIIQKALPGKTIVHIAMRYGRPSIRERLNQLREAQVDRIVVLPLYPQYSAATSASTFDAINKVLAEWRYVPEVTFISHYWREPAYIAAVAASIDEHWRTSGRAQLLLMSFHGLPARSRTQGDPYYDQCVGTAQAIANRLELRDDEWRLVFQSRFGAEEWLKPYCIDVLKSLPKEGVRTVDVVCPGFSADCLETLEEIAIAIKEEFLDAGGVEYRYIAALNAREDHAAAIANIILRRIEPDLVSQD